eukprot:6805422-Pyramimonas_sp.AAC.1
MVARKEYHAQYLSAVFGSLACDGEVFREGHVHENSNPWARQAQQDILALRETESGQELITNNNIHTILFDDPD